MSKELGEGQIIFRSSTMTSYKDSGITSLNDVPIANKESYDILVGDSKPFEFINKVQLGESAPAKPDPYTTIILTEEWAKSFVAAVKKVVKPVFIGGHADASVGYKARAIPDGYVTGGLVKDEVLYLRNTLPTNGSMEKKALVDQTANEIKAKMLSTSTSDYMKYDYTVDEDTNEIIYYAKESVKAQSNALVEEDQTGSEAEIIITSFKAIDAVDDDKGDKSMGEKNFTNVELFVSLKNQIDSGRLALSEVADKLGVDLMTTKQKAALKRLNDVESKVGNVTEFIEAVKAEKESNFAALKETKIKDRFKTEEMIEIATPLFNLKEGNAEEIDGELDRIADLKAFKAIQGKIASSINGSPDGSSVASTEETGEVMEA